MDARISTTRCTSQLQTGHPWAQKSGEPPRRRTRRKHFDLLSSFVYSVKRINESSHFFHRRVATPFYSFFSVPNFMAIFRRGPPHEGVECMWDRQKSQLSTNIWLHRALLTLPPPSVIHTPVPDCGKLVTRIAGKRRRLLFAGDDERQSVYDRKTQRYAEDRRQQNIA